MCLKIDFVRGGGVAHRFPFADFSHTPDGCPSDRVMDEGHHRRYNVVQKLARLRGVEPPAFGLASRCSVGYPRVPVEGASRLASPLSYRRAGTPQLTRLV